MRRIACIWLSEIHGEIASHALARVAEAALAFGPTTSFDVARHVVWVDVGGCAHLHGSEEALARGLQSRVRALGHTARVAVADGPTIASAVARLAPPTAEGPLVVPAGKGAAAMRRLPVAALGLDEEVNEWLRDLGLTKCGDLQRLPRRSLGLRLRARVHDVMQLLDGEDRAPLDAWRPPEVPEERVELEWGVESTGELAFVLKTLCDRLAARLAGRAKAAARLEIVLTLDRALCQGRSPLVTLEIVLPVPLAKAADLLSVARARLESHVLAAPVLAAALRATELARANGHTLDLLEPEPKADLALPRLAAELSAELGPSRVGVLALVDTWVPDERTRLVPLGSRPPALRRPLVTSALEPSRLVEPRPLARASLASERPLARIEGVEWWRRGTSRRDLVAAWAEPDRALAWVELREDEAVLLGWID